jgi:tRNA (cmo5U34)-methyltransferase
MNEELTFNSEKSLAYEKTSRTSIPTYDMLFGMVQSYFRLQLRDKKASILIIGAGGGNELSAWGPSNSQWTFTGIDPSEEMLLMAKSKTVQLGLDNRVKLIQGTMGDLPLQDSEFDAASCILVFHFIFDEQEKLNTLKTIRKHLVKGAPFVLVSAYGDRDAVEFQSRLNVWKSFWVDAGREESSVDEMISVGIMNPTKISLISEDKIEQLLEQSGFSNITRFYSTGLFAGWICHAK